MQKENRELLYKDSNSKNKSNLLNKIKNDVNGEASNNSAASTMNNSTISTTNNTTYNTNNNTTSNSGANTRANTPRTHSLINSSTINTTTNSNNNNTQIPHIDKSQSIIIPNHVLLDNNLIFYIPIDRIVIVIKAIFENGNININLQRSLYEQLENNCYILNKQGLVVSRIGQVKTVHNIIRKLLKNVNLTGKQFLHNCFYIFLFFFIFVDIFS